jgi:hypothetical protein
VAKQAAPDNAPQTRHHPDKYAKQQGAQQE